MISLGSEKMTKWSSDSLTFSLAKLSQVPVRLGWVAYTYTTTQNKSNKQLLDQLESRDLI